MCDVTASRWLVSLWDFESQTTTQIGVYADSAQEAITEAERCTGIEATDLSKVASGYPRKDAS